MQTLAAESGMESETLQRFLARNAGVAEGRLTKKGQKTMRAAFRKTVLVVDEGSLASTVQARDLLRIASVVRIPKVVLVGDSKQLDAVDAGKPFEQLQAAGMKTATMDEIMRQRDPDLKAAVEATLAGEVGKAFQKLGSNVAEVNPDNIAGAVAARWLRLSPYERSRTGVMAPSHALREHINEHVRERLVREGRHPGSQAMQSERLVSRGYTRAEKALAGNYSPGDVVAFHRAYKRLGVEKGEERRVLRIDHRKRTVDLEGPNGSVAEWKPSQIGGRQGGTEVYRCESIELRAGDRVRWTRNDASLGLVNSGLAEVTGVKNGRVRFRLEDGRSLELGGNDAQLRHVDRAWASTVHAFQGRTVDNVIAAMEARHPNLTTQKSFYVEISRARDRAELVTDDAAALKEQLEAATGERISALEGIGEKPGLEAERDGKVAARGRGTGTRGCGGAPARGRDRTGARAGKGGGTRAAGPRKGVRTGDGSVTGHVSMRARCRNRDENRHKFLRKGHKAVPKTSSPRTQPQRKEPENEPRPKRKRSRPRTTGEARAAHDPVFRTRMGPDRRVRGRARALARGVRAVRGAGGDRGAAGHLGGQAGPAHRVHVPLCVRAGHVQARADEGGGAGQAVGKGDRLGPQGAGRAAGSGIRIRAAGRCDMGRFAGESRSANGDSPGVAGDRGDQRGKAGRDSVRRFAGLS